MNTQQIIDTLDAEIARLQQARTLLSGSSNGHLPSSINMVTGLHGKMISKRKPAAGRKKRVLSDEARERIVAAQHRRWARVARENLKSGILS